MHRPPMLTDDGFLTLDSVVEPILDEPLRVPKICGSMRLENTSDSLRGVLKDLVVAGRFRDQCSLIGRSGHSQIGLDICLGQGEPEINTMRHRVDIPVELYSLNRDIPDTLFAEIKTLLDGNRRLTIGRLLIPQGPALKKKEIQALIEQHELLLPSGAKIDSRGGITIPLEDRRYLLSNTLLTAGQNAQLVLLQSKEGLSLIQYPSLGGLPEQLEPGTFLCGAIHISLGRCCALIDRETSTPGVFHLAARLLDAVRTSGINVPRQVEIYNGSDKPVSLQELLINIRLYQADPLTTRMAARVFLENRKEKILREGVAFAEATGIFKQEVYEPLFDGISPEPTMRGCFGRILGRNKSIEIPRELPENEWHESAQNRILYEVVRGNITSGVRSGEQIAPEHRGFVDSLGLVGGDQNIRRVCVTHEFPSTDTLRVLKRNNVGVFIARNIRLEEGMMGGGGVEVMSQPNLYFGQTTYESFCDLACREGVLFYMLFNGAGETHLREFYRGFWVTEEGKEKLDQAHTRVAMYGSHVEGTAKVLTEQIHRFIQKLKGVPRVNGQFAICHGSGPGVMKIADEAATAEGILRIGIGIDSEKIGQRANLSPPVILNFKNSARHMRQNILDRTSLFKIYNIGGMGTLEELLIAITNLKLFECLPAPHIFVDPFGLGQDGSHFWQCTYEQLKTATTEKKIDGHSVRLAPAWVINFCHIVKNYEEVLEIIASFVKDPVAYWQRTGIPKADLLQAYANISRAGVMVPPYLQSALDSLKDEV
ncbi:MAG: LOG family protein [Proteobacteria bacterium]|nr:LOG family protein [Pseudomonadota bacterium]MBU1688541.1 LOG family protein [Pseudomonadota bacterium]